MGEKRININTGFVTNSSSMVYHFPKELWEHPEIRAIASAYGVLNSGYVGYVWSRDSCESVAVTRQEKQELFDAFQDCGYGTPPHIDVSNDGPIIVFGDEYDGLAQTIVGLAWTLCRNDSSLTPPSGADYH